MNDTNSAENMSRRQPTQSAVKVFESRGITGQEQKIEHIKESAAFLWDAINDISVPPGNGSEAARLIATAKTQLEVAVMTAVKAVSRFNQ